jgi:hypothetical protein
MQAQRRPPEIATWQVPPTLAKMMEPSGHDPRRDRLSIQ